jgi:hypothetical protein
MLVAFGAGACSGDGAKKRGGAKLAQDCQLNSECDDPLTCTFQRCHQQCRKDRDCPSSERCVKGDTGSVCQLTDETTCNSKAACEGEQVCGVDAECRDKCATDTDCIDGQICANSKECASRDPAKDIVDRAGNIVPSGDGDGGPTGGGGAGGADAGTGGNPN